MSTGNDPFEGAERCACGARFKPGLGCENNYYMAINDPAFNLTVDSKERKTYPIATGVLDYFPLAIAEVARLSWIGNEKHNPGQHLHWAREKSFDHDDCLMRHFMDRGTIDTDGIPHSAKVAWRALAILQLELEKLNETK